MSKEWITARDGLVRGNDPKDRASHVDMDGQVVGIDEDFEDPLSGNSGPAPGMFNAPEDDINCRCTTGGLYEGDEAV